MGGGKCERTLIGRREERSRGVFPSLLIRQQDKEGPVELLAPECAQSG